MIGVPEMLNFRCMSERNTASLEGLLKVRSRMQKAIGYTSFVDALDSRITCSNPSITV